MLPTTSGDRLDRATAPLREERFAEALTLAHAVRWSDDHDPAREQAQGLIDAVLTRTLHEDRLPTAAGDAYHRWYYDNLVWMMTRYLGIPIWKSPTVDVDHGPLHPTLREEPTIELRLGSSTDASVARRIGELRAAYPGPAFAILDSGHRKARVLDELEMLRPLLVEADYVVVEDGNVNGHPVLPEWGEGPYESGEEYFARHPADYERDGGPERKFGFTFAVNGFLKRR